MGLRNNATMITRTQLAVPVRTYMSIGTSDLTLKLISTGNYTLSFTNKVWKDQAARDAGTRAFETKHYIIPLVERGMAANMYTTAYNHIKTIYTDTTDV
jgi:hypothetical protein